MTVRVEWLSTAELDAVYAEALSILESVGMRMKGAAVLDVLRDAGAAVDETGVVRFPAELVERAVAACPRDLLMAGETPAAGRRSWTGRAAFFNVSGCAAKTLDGDTGLVRPSTLADLRDGTIVLDATPELDVVWTFLTATDVPLERRELVEYYTYLTETAKPVVFVDCPSDDRATCAASSRSRPATSSASARGRACRCCARRARRSRSTASCWTWPSSSPRWGRRSGCTRCPSRAPRRRSRRPGRWRSCGRRCWAPSRPSRRPSPAPRCSPAAAPASSTCATRRCRSATWRARSWAPRPPSWATTWASRSTTPASPPTPSTAASRPATRRASR